MTGGAGLRGKHLHFDMPSGMAGDMFLGACFDVGVPREIVESAVRGTGLEGWELGVERCLRRGMAGVDVKVRVRVRSGHGHGHGGDQDQDHVHDHGGGHGHRHWGEIRGMLEGLEGEVRRLALDIFGRVARAEARLHGVGIDEVAFHEVGAVDSIVDIVGAAACLAWLAPVSVSAGAVPVGSGKVKTAHGWLPVPAPATLEILREVGAPVVDGGLAKELCTPTGAAILAAVVGTWGAMPAVRPVAIGYGAGDADFADRPNLVRVVIGEREGGAAYETLVELAANIDDMNPELCEHVAERLFAAGALDVWWTPVVMKKGRPALVAGVLGPQEATAALERVLLTETTTLGVRHHAVARRALERRVDRVETGWGTIEVKVGLLDGQVRHAAPEYASCRERALAAGVPLKEVYAAAVEAWRKGQGCPA